MGGVVKYDEPIAATVHDHVGHGAEPAVFGVFVDGDGPERVVIECRVGCLPAGQFVSGHRVCSDVAAVKTNGFDLVADHAFDAAHVGERGCFRVDQWFQCAEDFGHGLERVAQYEHVRFGFGECRQGGFADDAVGFSGGVGAVVVVPCGHFAAGVDESACQ